MGGGASSGDGGEAYNFQKSIIILFIGKKTVIENENDPFPPLNDELVAFGKAIASGDPDAISQTRDALRHAV
ncbi:MAG TPA: hypothetical protein VLA72_08390, partial [Anaerolineales bacterium]|nr:hypothetical protein [Anaerolineales bacterium]